jgi:hypothetical protein
MVLAQETQHNMVRIVRRRAVAYVAGSIMDEEPLSTGTASTGRAELCTI